MPEQSKGRPEYPSYLKAHEDGSLAKAILKSSQMLESCCLCPRRCKVNRMQDERGVCKTGLNPKVCNFMPHHGEEPPISGQRGSGTIFFSHCNMSCVYCQNYEFSQLGEGQEVDTEKLADFMLQLQDMGCHNINLVTPTHVMPQILKALSQAILGGLQIPLVYNTSGYELPDVIGVLEGIVDIYLADMRYADDEMAIQYSCAPGYVECSQQALKEMHRQVGVAKIDNHGIIKSGVIIRHLVLPNNISGTAKIMQFIAKELAEDSYISLMSQYLPCYKAACFKALSRRISYEEYVEAKQLMYNYGLGNGWTQGAHGLERFAGINIKTNISGEK